MIQIFWRKLRSIGYLLTQESDPWGAIAQRASENIRQAILACKRAIQVK